MTRVLVTGDRHWTAEAPIAALVRHMVPGRDTLIHGAARGADTMAAKLALACGLDVDLPPTQDHPFGGYPADWMQFHRAAGPIRNRRMMRDGRPDVVIAFHNDLTRSLGTRDMLRVAHAAGVEWRAYDASGRQIPRREVLALIG